MLRTAPIRRFSNDLDKSYTADNYMDLVVWYESSGEVHGFQLCYDRYDRPRAVTWTRGRGFSHCVVQPYGETGLGFGMSPVLESNNEFSWSMVLCEFNERSTGLDPAIRQLVQEQIATHGPRYAMQTV
ncbi:hypothetical protein AYO49_00760 [Verrucomicrobiaceae bacterium SCGC AG-212-N21]|nr:hypothetical protein AYO49_00760 [Verrucomicrobiaceae bacterium SCGC AG-212-N21]